jgi:uncharacterized membrane protein
LSLSTVPPGALSKSGALAGSIRHQGHWASALETSDGSYFTPIEGVALGISRHREVVGVIPGASLRGFSWLSGTTVELPGVPGEDSWYAKGVNDSGTIVGAALTLTPRGVSRAVRWATRTSGPEVLRGIPEASIAERVNNRGSVVGRYGVGVSGSAQGAWLLRGERVELLTDFEAWSLNDADHVTGSTTGSRAVGAVWSRGQLRLLESLPQATSCVAFGTDASGMRSVGRCVVAGAEVATLWLDRTPIELVTVTAGVLKLHTAWAVNDSGVIAASGEDEYGRGAFLLLPQSGDSPPYRDVNHTNDTLATHTQRMTPCASVDQPTLRSESR